MDSLSNPHPPCCGVRLVVAYDGTDFHGWQRQPNQRTVQGELESAVLHMGGNATTVRSAGRTDSGVHALQQFAAFDAYRNIPLRGWILGLNQLLPQDISVKEAVYCPVGYNPRFEAVDKTYVYLLDLSSTRNPLWQRYAWHLSSRRTHNAELQLPALKEAAQHLLGTHDFKAFQATDEHRENTVRTIHAIHIQEHFLGQPGLVQISVRGSGFLKHMVRNIIGTLLEVGCGEKHPDWILSLLAPTASRSDAGPTAPPHGLSLLSVTLRDMNS